MSAWFDQHTFAALLRRYQPSPFERYDDADSRFRRPMHHALKCRERFLIALRSGLTGLPEGETTIVDFGPYPGSLLRLIRAWRRDPRLRLYGAGLMTSPDFVRFMQEDCGAHILTVNLDPSGRQFSAKGYAEQVPLPSASAHLVFALEIIEHLSSPYHLLDEAYRLLIPGGRVVITTPNVTRIGNIFKLLAGKTPHDRLAPPGYQNPDDEWQPHVREYAMAELAQMLAHAGFDIATRRFFLGEDTQECIRSMTQRGIDWVKLPFFIIPHLRGSLLIVGRKPA